MLALAGVVQGNSIILENDNITNYDGRNIILTVLDGVSQERKTKRKIDFDSYGEPTERGKDVDKYMKEIRENDRL